MMFLKRELEYPAAEEASRACDGERMQGETFRQKEQKTDHTLNCVLINQYRNRWDGLKAIKVVLH